MSSSVDVGLGQRADHSNVPTQRFAECKTVRLFPIRPTQPSRLFGGGHCSYGKGASYQVVEGMVPCLLLLLCHQWSQIMENIIGPCCLSEKLISQHVHCALVVLKQIIQPDWEYEPWPILVTCPSLACTVHSLSSDGVNVDMCGMHRLWATGKVTP